MRMKTTFLSILYLLYILWDLLSVSDLDIISFSFCSDNTELPLKNVRWYSPYIPPLQYLKLDGRQNLLNNGVSYISIIPTNTNDVCYVPIIPTLNLKVDEKGH